ncbi:aminotransferase class I/II-fold pyridoxal phosphate-dependent enzyme [Symbioplanes lichenis]|uniref:aminotransferase class I/II-fold pyridoxal phosphate-dependent enzyme n=1 Tax=Symbioplanes lichenis TaxID=1629072 RepID=UPI0027387CF1|nr:aminotransferase class I/II-fold pyridoxal phosphate-dependent enzyme [Actinoplanes lichenis]
MAEQYQVSGTTAASIAASIEAGVLSGDFAHGEKLPAIRLLAHGLRVSPATVAKAYQELRQRGILEAAGRSGTRVRQRPPVASPRSALRIAAPPGTLDLSSGDPDVRLMAPLGPYLREVAAELREPGDYSVGGVLPELESAARARLAADGVPVGDGPIALTNGALDAMECLLVTHLRPGDTVAVEDPGWANLLDLVAALGLTAVPLEVDDEGPTTDGLASALLAGVRAVIITARAQNPTGAAVTAERAAMLRLLLTVHPGVLLIEDDHAAELAGVPLHCLGGTTARWAFVRSASKPFGPDLRMAVVAGDATTMGRLTGRQRITTGWVSTMLQSLLLRLWQAETVAERIIAAGASYDRRRRALRAALSARGVRAHGATGINIWVRVEDETRTVTELRDRGYAVAQGALFRHGSPPGVRVTVSRLDDADVEPLADALAAAVLPAGPGLSGR